MAPQSPEMAHVDFGVPRHPVHPGSQGTPPVAHDGYVPINSTGMNYGSASFHHGSAVNSPALQHHGSSMNSPALQHYGSHHGSAVNSPAMHHNGSAVNSPAIQHGTPTFHHGSSMNSPVVQHGTPTFSHGSIHQSPSYPNSPLVGQTPRSPLVGSARLPNSAHPDLRLPLQSTHDSPSVRPRNPVQESPQLRHLSPEEGSSQLRHLESPQLRHLVPAEGSPQLRNVTSPDSPQLNGTSAQSNRIKCVLIGDGAVGKTSLIISYTTNGYPDKYVPTAIDTYKAVVHVNGEAVTFELCDTPGQDDFDTLRPLVYPNTDVFVLCFSVVMPSTFSNVKEKWLPEVRASCGKAPVVLVGTQSDLREDMKTLVGLAEFKEVPVPESEAKKLASSLGCVAYVESSSLTQKNLKDVFDHAIMAGMGFRTKREEKKLKKKKKLCTIL